MLSPFSFSGFSFLNSGYHPGFPFCHPGRFEYTPNRLRWGPFLARLLALGRAVVRFVTRAATFFGSSTSNPRRSRRTERFRNADRGLSYQSGGREGTRV